MTPVTLSGLNSGLDTSSVINQLLQGDRARVSKMQWRQTAISSQQSQLKDVATKLTAVLNAVKALTSDSAYARTQQVVSSDAAKVAVAPLGGSGVGGYALQVDRMASAAQRTYAYDPDSDQTLTVGTSTFNFPAGTKIADAATKINASNDATVYAAAVEGKLILSARTSGAQSDFTAAGLVEDVSAAKVGDRLDALIRLDGDATARRSATNVIENLIPGLRLTIKSTTTSPVSISISQPALDEEALKTKIKAVATAFNALADTVRNVTTEKTIKDPKSASQAAKGGLFGDRALISLAGQARTLLGAAAAAGIKPPKAGNSEEGKSGHLSSDDAAITKALEDPAQLKAVFAALAQKLEPFVKTQNSGLIDARVASGTRQAKQITDAMTRQNARIDTEQKRLATQFASMEKALGLSQSQQAWLASAISALP